MGKVHNLKTWPQFYNQVSEGTKTFGVRKNDRDFKIGDLLNLYEFDTEQNDYTGKLCIVQVKSILNGGKFGIEEGYIVMSIVKI